MTPKPKHVSPSHQLEYRRRYYLRNREKKILVRKAYEAANPAKVKLWGAKAGAKYRAAHPDQKREHYQANRDVLRAKARAYHKSSYARRKAHISAVNRRCHAVRRNAPTDNLVDHVIKSFKEQPTFLCYYCDAEFSADKLHIDHIIPLSRGGSHTVDNVCTACAFCNLSKNAKFGTVPDCCCFPSLIAARRAHALWDKATAGS